MFGPHPYHRSVWRDVAAVVFVLALVLVPLGYLAVETIGGAGFGGTGPGVVTRDAPSAAPAAPRSVGSQWGARRSVRPARPVASTPFGGGRATKDRTSRSTVPFSLSWRAEATPTLSGRGDGPSTGRSITGGSAGTFGPDGVSTGGRSRSYASSGQASSGASGETWTAEARTFASRAQALSRQLGQMAQDPVARSLGEEAAPSEASSPASPTPAATTNDNPPTPEQPTLPIDDHVHWLLVAGLLWGVWRLTRG